MDIKKLKLLPALFLCLAALLCAAPAKAQDDPSAMMADCAICSRLADEMDLIMQCDYHVCDSKDGVLFQINLKNPTMMKRFRDFENRDLELSKKFKAASAEVCKAKLCPPCAEYMGFVRDGLKEERVVTPTGTIHLCRTADAKLLARVHDWSARMREMMAGFDMPGEETAVAADACCGTCSGDAEKESCCGSCGGAESKESSSGKAADPFAEIPEFVLEQMKKCHLCEVFIANPDMMTAAKSEIVFLDHGIVITSTVKDPKNLGRYQKIETDLHARISKLMEISQEEAKKKICTFCGQFCDLSHAGALMDWSLTPKGSISVFYSHDPAVVARITGLGKMMEAFNK